MNIDDKIKKRMDELENAMKSNAHINETLYVMDLYYSVRKLWSRLSEEDRDFLHGVEYALEHKTEWNV
jgi:hypothetical protein